MNRKGGKPRGKPFEKNNPGKQKGVVHTYTKTVKDSVLHVFQLLQSDPKHSLEAFAKTHPKDFYNIASKLIPTEVNANLTSKVIKVKVPGETEE
jgi:hypothetical protein